MGSSLEDNLGEVFGSLRLSCRVKVGDLFLAARDFVLGGGVGEEPFPVAALEDSVRSVRRDLVLRGG